MAKPSFKEQMNRISADIFEKRLPEVFDEFVLQMGVSITEGDPRTGSPGQPVGPDVPPHIHLVDSWQVDPTGPLAAAIWTDKVYAPGIEHGVGPYGPLTLRSAVGGFHSVAETVANADRILDDVVKKHAGA